METYLQRYGWVGTLLLLGLGSLLVAMILNGYLASKLAPYTVPVLPSVSAAKGAKKPAARPTVTDRVDAIAKRCLFGCVEKAPEPPACDPACGPDEVCQDGACVSNKPAEGVASDLPVPSDLPLKLVGVMVANREEWSTAILQDNATRQTYIVRVGELVPGEARLVEVHRQYIVFERNGRKEFIKLDGALMGSPSTVSTMPLSQRPAINPAPPSAARPDAPIPDVVEAPSQQGLVVSRQTLDDKLKDRNALAAGASVAPNFKNGQANGIKLVSVQPDSVYTKLGLQSGDVIQSINGEQIKSQQHAMELMEKFRGSDSVSIELERRGRKEKLDYKIK